MECAGPLRLKLRSVCWTMHSGFEETRAIGKLLWTIERKRPSIASYDFCFAKKADGKLTQGGWKP
jgi:hypothetical protein